MHVTLTAVARVGIATAVTLEASDGPANQADRQIIGHRLAARTNHCLLLDEERVECRRELDEIIRVWVFKGDDVVQGRRIVRKAIVCAPPNEDVL